MWRNWINCLMFFVKLKKHRRICWKQRTVSACAAKIVDFHNDQKTARGSSDEDLHHNRSK